MSGAIKDGADNVPEIEITPEMIEAGGRVVRSLLAADYGVGFGLSELVAREVLRKVLLFKDGASKPA